MEYHTSTQRRPIDIVNVADLEASVAKNMTRGAFGYLAGAAESEITRKSNLAAFEHRKILPRVLRNLENPDLTTEIFGIPISAPIIAAPIAAHGLVHENAEKETVVGVGEAETIFSLSTYGNSTVDEVYQASPDTPKFFQLYMSKDDNFNKWILDLAVKDGYQAIILTADSTLGGYREADIVNNFTFPNVMENLAEWSKISSSSESGEGKGIAQIYAEAKQALNLNDISNIKKWTNLPVLIKGVESPLDIPDLISAGADGIWVSNHGGRQLDGGPASFDCLREVAQAVNHQVPIIFDSGVRRGQHIFKALADGADLVAIGRPMLWGLNLGGSLGVRDVFNHFKKELRIDMQLAGCKSVDDIKATKLVDDK